MNTYDNESSNHNSVGQPENSGSDQTNNSGQFKKGVSGNPAGKPKGAKNAFSKKDVEIYEFLWQRLRSANRPPIAAFTLPDMSTLEGRWKAIDEVLNQLASGNISDLEARAFKELIELRMKPFLA